MPLLVTVQLREMDSREMRENEGRERWGTICNPGSWLDVNQDV